MPELNNVIKEKIYRGHKSRSGKSWHEKQLAGYLVAGEIDGQVGIGFSLCHKVDRYDFIKGVRHPGHGLKMATNRAIKSAQSGRCEVPPSLLKRTILFANRCERCFKKLPRPDIHEQLVPDMPARKPHLFIETRDRQPISEEM